MPVTQRIILTPCLFGGMAFSFLGHEALFDCYGLAPAQAPWYRGQLRRILAWKRHYPSGMMPARLPVGKRRRENMKLRVLDMWLPVAL